MTATNHSLTGALIAVAVTNPIAIPLAFLAHFAMDAIPHFGISETDVFKKPDNKIFRTVLSTDSLVALVGLILVPIALHRVVPIWLSLACMIACMSPDLVWGWHYYHVIKNHVHRKRSWFSRLHKKIQWKEVEWGASVEAVWLAACIWIILVLR